MFSALNFWDVFNWNGWIELEFFSAENGGVSLEGWNIDNYNAQIIDV